MWDIVYFSQSNQLSKSLELRIKLRSFRQSDLVNCTSGECHFTSTQLVFHLFGQLNFSRFIRRLEVFNRMSQSMVIYVPARLTTSSSPPWLLSHSLNNVIDTIRMKSSWRTSPSLLCHIQGIMEKIKKMLMSEHIRQFSNHHHHHWGEDPRILMKFCVYLSVWHQWIVVVARKENRPWGCTRTGNGA